MLLARGIRFQVMAVEPLPHFWHLALDLDDVQ